MLLTRLADQAPLLLALGVGIGLVLPDLATLTRPYLSASIWVLLVITALRIEPGSALDTLRRPLRVIWVAVFMLGVTVLLAWGLMQILDLPPGLETAIILMAGTAPLMSTAALSQLLGLDDSLAMLGMILGMMLLPFVLPAVALFVLGLDLSIDPLAWSGELLIFIGSAVGAGLLIRRLLGRERVQRFKPQSDLAVVFLLLLFAVAIMDGVAVRLAEETGYVLLMVLISFIAYLALLASGSVAGSLIDRRTARSMGFICANRNVGILLAVLPASADPDIAMYFAIWQIPMYVMPLLLKPVYRRWAAG